MKITLVRGAFLNPFEMQLYRPLAEKLDVMVVGANWQFYPHSLDWPLDKVRQARLWGSALASLNHQAPAVWNRALSWTMGRSYGLKGLSALIGQPDILHAAESFFTMTYQCLQ